MRLNLKLNKPLVTLDLVAHVYTVNGRILTLHDGLLVCTSFTDELYNRPLMLSRSITSV